MPAPLSFECTSDPVEARTWFAELIEREPVAMSVIAGVTAALIADPSRYANPRWWTGRADADTVAASMHTPPHVLHIALSSVEAAQALAARLVEQDDHLEGVGGTREAAKGFAATWCRLTGAAQETTMELATYDLPGRPTLPFEVPGSFRLARPDELALVDGWMRDFDADAHPDAPPSNTLARHVADGRVGLWVVEGEPVAMAAASVPNGGVTRILAVFTPRPLRGRGYASAVVAAMSTDRMNRGERCMLYTDLANPTSNAIYQALGYRRVGDSIHITFS